MESMNTKTKSYNLEKNIKKYNRVIIAFSGGVDSSFLLAVSEAALGKENVIAVTASSETYTESELSLAKEMAAETGVRHIILETGELNNPDFVSNTADRCYFCKKDFYSKIMELSKKMGISNVLDGSNADDVSDYRPGRKAAIEFGIISPLIEEGFTKKDIRLLSKELGLSVWDKPANPCLASRIPYGSKITTERLEAVFKAEAFIRSKGFSIVRVRHHDQIARIELPVQDIGRLMQDSIREEIARYFKSLGFVWITIDVEGYRMGSLNSALKGSSK
jgi:pyridinium-3,5-biscarboxylic acid mononucleotide sulfurtransferase